jgi:putative hemolysin
MTVLEIIVVLVLILGAGFFAMAEFSVVSSRRNRLEQLAARGHRGAQSAIELADQPVRFLAAVQVGATLSTMLVGALTGAVLAARLAGWLGQYPAIAPFCTPAAMVIVIAASTYVSLILGEMLPKQIALKYPEAVASRLAPTLAVLAWMAAPIVWALDSSTNLILRGLKLRKGSAQTVTEEDIHNIVAEGAKLGIIHHVERDMIEGVLDLADSPVRSIMTPRPHLAWVDINESRDSILGRVGSCPFAQLLVSRDSIDEVVGVVRKQDLLDQSLRGESIDIERAVRSPLVVPEGTSILRTLDLFRATPVNEALVVDEFGSVQGIVTRTDLLEAVAGDLAKVEGEPTGKVTRQADGSFIMDAAMPMDEAAKVLKPKSLPPGDFVTLGGFVLSRLNRMPECGEHFTWEDWDFQVAEVNRSRIGHLLVRPRQ